MRTLAVSALAAVLVHVFLFTLNPPWKRPRMVQPTQRAVTVSLAERAPAAAATSPAADPIDPLPLMQPEPIAPLHPTAFQKSAPAKAVSHPKPIPQPVVKPQPKPQITKPDASALTSIQTPNAASAADSNSASASPPDLTPTDQNVVANQSPVQASMPRYDLNPKPDYPAIARRRAYQGTVQLKVLVDTRGQAARIELTRSSGHEMLDRSALKSVAAWRFEPARRDGQPIEMWVEVPVRYELH